MGELEVSESVVVGVAKSLRAVADDTKSGLAGLDDELSRLLGMGWTGQAGSASTGCGRVGTKAQTT
jgi:uncharacterized protein YukE